MKGTEQFKRTIEAYLQSRAKIDPLFAVSFAKENKSLDDCINYIFRQVKQQGCNGYTDEEIYGMAVHYYDEDSITKEDCNPIDCKVVVNHHIELSDDEKVELRENARKEFEQEMLHEMRKANQKKTPKTQETAPNQLSLF